MTKKFVVMPAANRFSSASSRRSCSMRAARVDCTRLRLVSTARAALRTSAATVQLQAAQAGRALLAVDLRARVAARPLRLKIG